MAFANTIYISRTGVEFSFSDAIIEDSVFEEVVPSPGFIYYYDWYKLNDKITGLAITSPDECLRNVFASTTSELVGIDGFINVFFDRSSTYDMMTSEQFFDLRVYHSSGNAKIIIRFDSGFDY